MIQLGEIRPCVFVQQRLHALLPRRGVGRVQHKAITESGPNHVLQAKGAIAARALGSRKRPILGGFVQHFESRVQPEIDRLLAGCRLDERVDFVDRCQEEISQVSPCLFVPHQRFASLPLNLFLVRLEKLRELLVSTALLGS